MLNLKKLYVKELYVDGNELTELPFSVLQGDFLKNREKVLQEVEENANPINRLKKFWNQL